MQTKSAARLGLPTTLRGTGYRLESMDLLADDCAASHFNFTSPYKPNAAEFRTMIEGVLVGCYLSRSATSRL